MVIEMNKKERIDRIERLKRIVFDELMFLETYGVRLVKEKHKLGGYVLSYVDNVKFNVHELINLLESEETTTKEDTNKKLTLLKNILNIMERDEKERRRQIDDDIATA